MFAMIRIFTIQTTLQLRQLWSSTDGGLNWGFSQHNCQTKVFFLMGKVQGTSPWFCCCWQKHYKSSEHCNKNQQSWQSLWTRKSDKKNSSIFTLQFSFLRCHSVLNASCFHFQSGHLHYFSKVKKLRWIWQHPTRTGTQNFIDRYRILYIFYYFFLFDFLFNIHM
jgi:hypothetical protein